MSGKKVVLLVEEEAAIARFLGTSLRDEFSVMEAATGREALSLAASKRPDAILLGFGLPDMGGLEVLKRIRQWTSIPVIVLSARGRERDKVEAFGLGADDYVTKPVGIPELSARLRAVLKRARQRGPAEKPSYKFGDLKVDLAARRVWIGKKECRLSPKEYELLAILARNAGLIVGRARLIQEIWGDSGEVSAGMVRYLVHQVRREIEPDPARPCYLKTEPGRGYRLESEGPE